MKNLSVGAALAWQIAAGEAGAARHQFVEMEHLFIGILSLEKVVALGPEKAGFRPRDWQALQAEYGAVRDVLGWCALDATRLRRYVREGLRQGNYQHTEEVIHRSEACKRVFSLADDLAAPVGQTSCLHLLAAVLGEPGEVIGRVLAHAGVKPADLRAAALARAGMHQGPGQEPKRFTRLATRRGRRAHYFLIGTAGISPGRREKADLGRSSAGEMNSFR